MASLAAFAPDPVESCVAEIVRAYGAWLKNQTNDLFESLGHAWDPFHAGGKGGEITDRLMNLGFRVVMRPAHGGGTRFDVWKRKDDHVDPASELGRMLGLPVPDPTRQQADKVQAVVRDINDQFSTWLLTNDYVPGAHSPSLDVQVGELSDSSRTLLRRMMAAHGWQIHDWVNAGGMDITFAFSRRVYVPCSCGGFASGKQQQKP